MPMARAEAAALLLIVPAIVVAVGWNCLHPPHGDGRIGNAR
jgi:hypothetical protein